MRTSLTVKTETLSLYSEETCYSMDKIGTLEIPDFDKMPEVLIVGDTVYLKRNVYPYKSYYATTLVHVAQASEIVQTKTLTPIAKPTTDAVQKLQEQHDLIEERAIEESLPY